MAKVEIYTADSCPYCLRAKLLLDQKGVGYVEIRVDGEPSKLEEMIKRSGRHSVPQIFINGRGIGGFDDLWQLEQRKELDLLINEHEDTDDRKTKR